MVPIMRSLAWLLAAVTVYCRAAATYETDDNVRVITSHAQFVAEVLGSDSLWLLHAYSSTTPKQIETISKVAELMKGIFPVGAIDLESYQGVEDLKTKYSITRSSLLVLGDDKKSQAYKTLSTRDLDLQEIIDAIVEAAGITISERSRRLGFTRGNDNGAADSHDRIALTSSDASFAEDVLDNPYVVMVAFTAPWCGYCKRLEPEWQQASRTLAKQSYARNAVRMVWVDATANPRLASQYQVKGYPTIYLFPGTSGSTNHGKTEADAKPYNGERTAAGMVQAILEEVDRSGVPFEIPQLTSGDVLKEQCSGANHICILAGLPHINDSGAEGRRKYQETLGKVAKSFRSSMAFSFLWFEGTSQLELEAALELTFGFPAVVALSMDREAFAVMRGAFTEKAVTSFLHSLTTGRQATAPLQASLNVVTVEPWNGQDAAPVEEEFSLEDIMGSDEL